MIHCLSVPQVIMTGDVSEGGGSRIFRSLDYGHSFSPADLPFFPLIQTLYNPNDSNVLLTLSITVHNPDPQHHCT